MTADRRERRSNRPAQALSLYLESLREKEELDAVAVSTDDGLLVAGSGPVDLDWLGAAASASTRPSFAWNQKTVHVKRFEHAGVPLVLSSAGKALFGSACTERIDHILGG